MIAIGIAIMVVSVIMIAVVLMQDSETGGLAALGGGSNDSFFGKNKSKALNARLALITKICAAVFVALCVLMLILA